MKLLNRSIIYISTSLLLIISVWAFIFYFNMLHEIKESTDEGLENYKRQIIFKAQTDSAILKQQAYDDGFFSIREITKLRALAVRDRYVDSLIYMQDADDEELELEPVRMLTSVFEKDGRYYQLTVINPMVEEDDLIKELFWDAFVLYLILIASIVLINNFVLQRLWRPFYNFLDQLKKYRLGTHKTLPEVKTKTKEFTDLQNAVNVLLQHNLEAYEQQKEFIGNASHELQTPLAIATSKLELLIEKGNLENRQAESIAEIMSIIERLVRLNKSLLLLSKIENKQIFTNEKIFINKVVKQSISDLAEVAEFKNVVISISKETELVVDMDASLANIIISNLLRNAVFHNTPNGSVEIMISENSITVMNTGRTEPLDREKIFTRFFKSQTESTGTGLGLTIVKAICSIYGFSISYRYKNDRHNFELEFDRH